MKRPTRQYLSRLLSTSSVFRRLGLGVLGAEEVTAEVDSLAAAWPDAGAVMLVTLTLGGPTAGLAAD